MDNTHIKIPRDALAIPDGDDPNEMVLPEPGEAIEISVTGKITEVSENGIFFKPIEVNGVPIPVTEKKMTLDEESKAIQTAAAKMDAQPPPPIL